MGRGASTHAYAHGERRLRKLAQPRLTVLRGSDYGPATKLIPTLQLLEQRGTQNATLLVVDDDTDYSPSLVCEYVKASHRHPGAALGYRGLYFNYRSKPCNGTQTLPAGYLSNGGTSPKGEDHDVDVLTVVVRTRPPSRLQPSRRRAHSCPRPIPLPAATPRVLSSRLLRTR